ncbi:hypothetical protein V2J09_008613 [Rumex salicifolius]
MKPFQSCNEESEAEEVRKGPWTLEEDNLLIQYIACNGEGRWNLLAKSAGLKRTGKSCRLRWLNYLKPDIKRGNLTPQEQLMILELHSKWGNRWSKIAQHLPGRTDNEIKNYWRTRVQKQAKHLNMETNSQSFIKAIRCYYMPRLIQGIEQNSSQSTIAMDYEDSSLPFESTMTSQFPPTKVEDDSVDLPYKDCSSSFANLESSTSSNPLEIPQNPSYHTNANTWENDTVAHFSDSSAFSAENWCDVDYPKYDMQQLASMSHMGQFSCAHLADHSWIGGDMANDTWNLDNLW